MAGRIRGLLEKLLGGRQSDTASESAPDSELLRRFVVGSDQEAFELLVWRHGVMVLGVCHRSVRDEHLAEDAFQAVFLVLAKQARSIRSGNVAGWLYRVARRVAATTARTRFPSQALPAITVECPESPIEQEELSKLLDIEVARLPDRLRQPVLLCYLGGRSTEEAARELGCPRGTILSRLSAARKLLSERLTRRGVALPSVLSVVGLGLNGRNVSATLAAIPRFLAGNALRDPVSLLAQGVIRTMKLSKLITLFGGILFTAALISWVGWAVAQSDSGGNVTNDASHQSEPRQEPQASKPTGEQPGSVKNGLDRSEPPIPEIKESDKILEVLQLDPVILNSLKPDPRDTPIRKLQKELCHELALFVAKTERLMNIGKWNPLDFSEVIKNRISLSKNLLELMEKPADKLTCYEMEVRFLKMVERFIDARVLVGSEPSQNHNIAKAARLEAEIKLLQFKAQIENPRRDRLEKK